MLKHDLVINLFVFWFFATGIASLVGGYLFCRFCFLGRRVLCENCMSVVNRRVCFKSSSKFFCAACVQTPPQKHIVAYTLFTVIPTLSTLFLMIVIEALEGFAWLLKIFG